MGASNGKIRGVVIGETGSGKTSFLNLIGNLQQMNSLTKHQPLTLDMVRHLHKEAKTDQNAAQGDSQTDKAFPHKISGLGFDLTLIDTPGFADTRGIDHDTKHAQKIQSAIEACDSINCIVLVINGANARMTAQMRFVMAQVTAIMPKQILDQIVVVLTNVADPLDLNFNTGDLTQFLGQSIPSSRVLMINNPYAKLTKLLSAEKVKQDVALKRIKNQFQETYDDVLVIFQTIAKFKAIGTSAFTRVYEARQQIEMSTAILQSELESIAAKRIKIAQLSKEVQQNESALASMGGSIKEKAWEETPGKHHMICRICHKTCHAGCSVPFGSDRTECFKDCQCFQWRKSKEITLRTDGDRRSFLSNVFDSNNNIIESEPPYKKIRSEQRIRSAENFSIGGVSIRGKPDKRWTNSAMYTDADCYDNTVTKAMIASASLPFTFQMNDWSNVELGEGMKCICCDCPLSSHMHQMSLPIWKNNSLFASTLNAKTSKEEAVAACHKELETMQARENEIKQTLRVSLEAFGKESISSSYVGFLNQQTTYLHILKNNSAAAGDVIGTESLTSQIIMIETMKETFLIAGGHE